MRILINHLFFKCDYIVTIWEEVLRRNGIVGQARHWEEERGVSIREARAKDFGAVMRKLAIIFQG